HALRCIAVTAHNTVRQRTVVGAYAHRRPILLAYIYKGGKFLVNALQLTLVLDVRIIYLIELLFVGIVAGIYAHFFNNARGHFGSIRSKMDIGNQWGVITALPQLFFYFGQVLGFFNTGRCDTYILAARFYHPDRLLHRGYSVHGIGGGHALNTDRITAAHRYIA